MLYKLSGSFSNYVKLSMTFLLATALLLIGNDLVGRFRHSMTPGTPWRLLWLVPYYYFFYKGVAYLTRDKVSVAYDETQVYITDHKIGTETAVPLERVLKLSMRPATGRAGSQIYRKYSLHYLDEAGQVVKVPFLHFWPNSYLTTFENLVKEKNPGFVVKNWTHSFDWKDN